MISPLLDALGNTEQTIPRLEAEKPNVEKQIAAERRKSAQ